jgi:hypothetical protein
MTKNNVNRMGSLALLAASVFLQTGCGSSSSAAPAIVTSSAATCYQTQQYGCLSSCTPTTTYNNGYYNNGSCGGSSISNTYAAGSCSYLSVNGTCEAEYITAVGNTGVNSVSGTGYTINGSQVTICGLNYSMCGTDPTTGQPEVATQLHGCVDASTVALNYCGQ